MTDADFFRRVVAERAETMSTLIGPFQAGEYLRIHVGEYLRLDSDSERTEHLVRIAALCERAAVDLTIPRSRLERATPKKGKRK